MRFFAENSFYILSSRRRAQEFVHEFHEEHVADECARREIDNQRKNAHGQIFFAEHRHDAERNAEYGSQKEEYCQVIQREQHGEGQKKDHSKRYEK